MADIQQQIVDGAAPVIEFVVLCRSEREPDGDRCTGEVRYPPGAVQAACTVCGGWRGRYAPAEPGPLVLSLPTAPDGAVGLRGAALGNEYLRAGGGWRVAGEATVYGLGKVLECEGSVTVVMREPRTVDVLTPDMELDMALLRGVSGRVWRREAAGPGWVTEGEHRCNIGDLFFTDGPLTEVLDG